MGSGPAITGGQFAIAPSPAVGAGLVAGAVAVDSTSIVALASAVVAHTGMYYGYDPARAEEKIFALAVVNWANARTAGTKGAAWADLTKVSRLLRRNEPWVKLNETVIARIATKFGERFSVNVYKRSLGKFVPVAAIAAGGALNWLTLENTADAADVAFRQRFLLDKYPAMSSDVGWVVAPAVADGGVEGDGAEAEDYEVPEEVISVTALLGEEGVDIGDLA